MINKREILITALVILILAMSLNLPISTSWEWKTILYTLLAVFIIVGVNILVKKWVAYRLDSEIEMRVWEIGKFGFAKEKHSKKPIPIGAFLPILSKIIFFPLNSFIWMASLVFEVKPRIYRGAKRFGLYTFSEMTEYHLGLIAASGIVINLIMAVVGYLLGFSLFARLNIYYAFFNMLPISELDGNKIFFGNLLLWSFLASLVLIGIIFGIFIR
jgi:hypothetical protein